MSDIAAGPLSRSPLRHLPNAICIMRILLVPPTLWLMVQGRFDLALGLVFLAGLSDGLDGFLAKTFNWRTWLGSVLDPLADKLLLMGVFLTLGWLGLLPGWLVFIAVGRDVLIITGALIYRFFIGQVSGTPTVLSKANTGVQLLLVLCVMSMQAFGMPGEQVITILGAIMFATVMTSGTNYLWSWTRRGMNEKRTA